MKINSIDYFQNSNVTTPPTTQHYGDSRKPIEIDESEEFERITLLKQRETLIRGLGK